MNEQCLKHCGWGAAVCFVVSLNMGGDVSGDVEVMLSPT